MRNYLEAPKSYDRELAFTSKVLQIRKEQPKSAEPITIIICPKKITGDISLFKFVNHNIKSISYGKEVFRQRKTC